MTVTVTGVFSVYDICVSHLDRASCACPSEPFKTMAKQSHLIHCLISPSLLMPLTPFGTVCALPRHRRRQSRSPLLEGGVPYSYLTKQKSHRICRNRST